MAGEAFCGIDEHVHDESCLPGWLICQPEEGVEHIHDESCKSFQLVCHLEAGEVHIHGESCLSSQLICQLEEGAAHTHDESCLSSQLICPLEEGVAHTHSISCLPSQLICQLEESEGHTHTEECVLKQLHCQLPEQDGHTHTEECSERHLICTLETTEAPAPQEEHIHSDSCYQDITVCTAAEEPVHTHDDTCFSPDLICALEESEEHAHGDGCYEKTLHCTLADVPPHTHSEACVSRTLVCDPVKPDLSYTHIHGDECYEQLLVCTTPEEPSHTHDDTCFTVTTLCTIEEAEGHTHTGECYLLPEHCQLEEHIHTPNCYSDLTADLETSDTWEDSFAHLIRSPSTAENILMLAQSQLGTAESTRNFQVDEFGIRHGISRYGQWYGNPYGDWSAMFAAFCLDYAGVMEVPYNAGPEAMRLNWEAEALYAPAADHGPLPGQLVFLDKDQDEKADSVAIVAALEENILTVIEGDLSEQVTQLDPVTLTPTVAQDPENPVDRVLETLYAMEDPAIMGYGLVPFEPGLLLLPEDGPALYAAMRTIWLDGTNGGLMSLGGSPNTSYRAEEGTKFTLPDQWQSPDKYSYTLRGWYDVINNVYYEPGAEVTVKGNMVFYADWAASTYNVGQFNAQVVDTVSTNDFVTVRMFDYGVLFNVLSERANVSFSNGGHTETWNLLTSGTNPYNGNNTLNYIFRDWDRGSEDISYPNGTNDRNNPTDAGKVFSGLYTNTIRDLLFNPSTKVIGKQYLGTGDHLFQLCLDPNHEHYGYYYYNSERNAASYNQSAQRFYVYNYLECTRTSYNSGDSNGKLSDFLPLNSPYANTNGKRVNTYRYAGVEGEYNGTTHYMYDCRYNDSDNSPNNVGTNFWFGMSVAVDFYLPNKPGTTVPGGYGNQDIYGKDMHFRFSGDDDVWIFVDGVMVLDLGGLHGMETGDINFSTGEVTVNGVVNRQLSDNLKSISAGEHTLTLYYLERGSSMSNCAIYFNLAPRFSFNIQKEDVLTRDVLNGAQFSVYMDQACTIPAELWESKASHDRKDPSTNTFTVTNGIASMWGMGAGNTYYIKETKPPDNPNYEGLPNGIIRLIFDKLGSADYNVEILDTGNGVSGGFTVHGLRIDTETQQAYIVATNAPKWAKEFTSIQARKQWDDQANHNGEAVTVYLTVTEQDGTVQRIREAQLSSANNWHYLWENLPKYWEDGTPVRYGIEEAYIPGYYSKIEEVQKYSMWQDKNNFENGKTYLLRSTSGYLATGSTGSDTGFVWLSQDAAAASKQAQWKATVTGNNVRLTNLAGQSLTFYYNGGSSGYPTDFFASTGGETNESKQNFRYSSTGSGLRIYYDGADGRDYYLRATMTDSKKFNYSTNASDALPITPVVKEEIAVTGSVSFLVTNTPLSRETSVSVSKIWDYGYLDPQNVHEQAQVTVRLLADGRDTGRSITLSLKNGWKGVFRGLPYEDEDGRVITYSVVETWDTTEWVADYGPVQTTPGDPPTYSTTVTNLYRKGMGGPQLPSTGTAARMIYILCGGSVMLASLVYGILLRRKRERRTK